MCVCNIICVQHTQKHTHIYRRKKNTFTYNGEQLQRNLRQLQGQIYTTLIRNLSVEPIIRDLVFFSPHMIHSIVAQNFPTRNSSQQLPNMYQKGEKHRYITVIQLSLESPINQSFLQSIAEENIHMQTQHQKFTYLTASEWYSLENNFSLYTQKVSIL